MHTRKIVRVAVACAIAICAMAARADEFSVAMGTPSIGSNIPLNRASLGIPVNIDSNWDQLVPEQQAIWRRYTDLLDPAVTPPFPQPNIRAFLRKLAAPDAVNTTEDMARVDNVFLAVRIDETGKVTSVDIMGGKELTRGEKLLAYRYSNALLSTTFSPAMLKGQAVASAFPMRIRQLTVMK